MMLILGSCFIALGVYGVRLKIKETELPGPIIHKFMITYGFGFGFLFLFVGTMDTLLALGLVKR